MTALGLSRSAVDLLQHCVHCSNDGLGFVWIALFAITGSFFLILAPVCILLRLAMFVYRLCLMYQAYSNKEYCIPFLGAPDQTSGKLVILTGFEQAVACRITDKFQGRLVREVSRGFGEWMLIGPENQVKTTKFSAFGGRKPLGCKDLWQLSKFRKKFHEYLAGTAP